MRITSLWSIHVPLIPLYEGYVGLRVPLNACVAPSTTNSVRGIAPSRVSRSEMLRFRGFEMFIIIFCLLFGLICGLLLGRPESMWDVIY